jgi:hypothetical protein
VEAPNEKLFKIEKEAQDANIDAGQANINPNPGFKVANAAIEAGKEFIDGSKPLPMASPEEQERRRDSMEATVKEKVKENFKNKN